MLDYNKEKQDAEAFITDVVKKLSPSNKQRVADIIRGVHLAEQLDKRPAYPQGVPVRCG